MGFVDLLVVALVPVIEVLIVTGIGLSLATQRINILGPDARHHLNNLVFYVLSPALVVSELAETITFSSLVSLWFMPVNILVTFIIGSVLGWILIKITKTPPHLQGLVIGSCCAGNLGNLLLILVPAVCDQSNSPFGDSTTCSTYAEAYASLSMAVGAVYIWSYVYFMMGLYATNNNNTDMMSDSDSTCPLITSSTHNIDILSHPISPGAFENFTSKIYLKMVFAPPTIAAIIGFIIGSVSPIRKLMIGSSAPLDVIYSSATLLGDAAIPSMTLIVGGNLLQGLQRGGVSKRVIIGIIGVRYVVMPVISVGVVKGAYHLGIVNVGSSNITSLYQFILMLQYALPPAMNIGTISQLFKAGESECSVIMLWTYVVVAFSLTLWSTFYMWLLR